MYNWTTIYRDFLFSVFLSKAIFNFIFPHHAMDRWLHPLVGCDHLSMPDIQWFSWFYKGPLENQ